VGKCAGGTRQADGFPENQHRPRDDKSSDTDLLSVGFSTLSTWDVGGVSKAQHSAIGTLLAGNRAAAGRR
jgi:hypothetical protein